MKTLGFILCILGGMLAVVSIISSIKVPLWAIAIPVAIVLIGMIIYRKGGGLLRL